MNEKTTNKQRVRDYQNRQRANGFIFTTVCLHSSVADRYRKEINALNKEIRARQYLERDRQYCIQQIAKIM